ncbi:MAG: patatin-like phospholipase family protein [Candidatus Magnetoovum sp. WYHC-5]|nr:patatin-like phospholipase family protein [Candidatus Magnetoovum sp. WYHC-5]
MAAKNINLALQGGSTHGSFTWGVLDRLLEETDLDIVGVSATSAGAVNGSLLVYGLLKGGKEEARKVLSEFWEKLAQKSLFSPLNQPTIIDRLYAEHPGNMNFNPVFWFFSTITRLYSPYQLMPFDINPLRDVLNEIIDFKVLQSSDHPKLFLSATNVKTGKIKIFSKDELSIKAVLASACLPFTFKSVEINNEYYWDGGYMGNPALYPLFYNTNCPDLLLVQINPINIPHVPTTAGDIVNTTTRIAFNSSLMREMRAVLFINSLVAKGFDDGGKLKRAHIHMIEAEDVMNTLNETSKMNLSGDFLSYLFNIGRQRAHAWIEANYDKIGKESSCSVEDIFLS